MKAEYFRWIQSTCICIASAAFAPDVGAQGYVLFANRIPGQLIAPIFGGEPNNPGTILQGNPTNGLPVGFTIYHGLPLAGTGFTAQLWAGPAGAPENQLQPVATTTFLTGSSAGFVQSSTVAIPSVSPGGQVSIQWRVWKNVGGTLTSWASLLAAGSVPRGSSPVFIVTTGSTPPTAPAIPALRSFNITCLSCGSLPFVSKMTADVNSVPGETVTFLMNSFGELPVTYQWLFNGVPLQNSPFITQTTSGSGFLTHSLILSNVQPGQAGQYSLSASNDFGLYVSSNATLSVFPPPYLASPRITAEGKFSLVLTGAPNRRYSIETSSNFTSWLPSTTVTNVSGEVSFTEDTSATDAARFYRARLLQ